LFILTSAFPCLGVAEGEDRCLLSLLFLKPNYFAFFFFNFINFHLCPLAPALNPSFVAFGTYFHTASNVMISSGFNIAVRTSFLILFFCKNTSGFFIGYWAVFLFIDYYKTFDTRRCSGLFLSAELTNSQFKNSPKTRCYRKKSFFTTELAENTENIFFIN